MFQQGCNLRNKRPSHARLSGLSSCIQQGRPSTWYAADLTGGNVMLTSCCSAARGLKAKVADFGLARKLDLKSRTETNIYGTVRNAVDNADAGLEA